MVRLSAPPRASVLIIAGGRGTRFWPASREARPKPLFSISGKTSLLADTIARHLKLVPRKRIFVLVAAAHEAAFRREVRGLIPPNNLIVEPQARGTAVAIAYGTAVIRRRLGDGVIASVAADHYISTAEQYRRTVAEAIGLAATHDSIVAIGIPPTRPETGYGYQKIGAKVGAGFRIEQFVEKPALPTARRMVQSGRYLWNASMFVASTRTLEREFAAHAPALGKAADRLARMSRAKLAPAYARLRYDSFDRVIMEKSANVLSVRARFSWHDVGSWEGLCNAVGGAGGNVIRGNAIALESERVLAHPDSRLMVLFGVRDLIVVDTGDAILIAHREMSPHVRRVTEELERRGLHRYL
ncbi:MAG TPA: mannose-1-phosphate guanylyltransferase [Patescibacteria group bacterium]|nr:mannose-1-phosphate guanylyltransferase [Patescibacteria group bacterium]